MLFHGNELLRDRPATLKFLLNANGIAIFSATLQHREVKLPGLSYEDDYRGNALAGIITPDHVEIRFHREFSDERVRILWMRVAANAEISAAGLGTVLYRGRALMG